MPNLFRYPTKQAINNLSVECLCRC